MKKQRWVHSLEYPYASLDAVELRYRAICHLAAALRRVELGYSDPQWSLASAGGHIVAWRRQMDRSIGVASVRRDRVDIMDTTPADRIRWCIFQVTYAKPDEPYVLRAAEAHLRELWKEQRR